MDSESGPARTLPELADRIPPEPDRSLCALLEAVAAQLQDVDNTAGSTHEREAAVARLAHLAILFLSPFPMSVGDNNERHRCYVSMSILDKLTDAPDTLFSDYVLLAIIPYADATSASSTDGLVGTSSSIISRQLSRRDRTNFIVSALLETAIKPHLSKWSSTRLTAAGRAAVYEDTGARNTPIDLGTSPPWVGQGATMILLFQWALKESDDALLQAHWPSFTPFLLALLDDPDTGSRAQGLRAAEVFIRECPAKVLAERGMGKVLEEAILPTLQFLPTHTPEDESAQLLEPAYTALILLASTRFAYDGDMGAKRSLLDRLLREGIFSAYSHASEYVRIVEVLAKKANSIIDELGIYATKHLKDIIPIFTSAMMDPFLAQHGQSLLAVSEALCSAILNCWPRALDRYRAEILRGVIVCWLNDGEDGPKAEGKMITETLRTIARLVSKSCDVSGGCSLSGLGQIIKDKPELRALFH